MLHTYCKIEKDRQIGKLLIFYEKKSCFNKYFTGLVPSVKPLMYQFDSLTLLDTVIAFVHAFNKHILTTKQ